MVAVKWEGRETQVYINADSKWIIKEEALDVYSTEEVYAQKDITVVKEWWLAYERNLISVYEPWKNREELDMQRR